MARRSPLNERYQKNTAPAGKTRKSAASAKPKRTSSSPSTPSKSSSKSKPSEAARRAYAVPDNPEFKRLRTTWWWLLGIATVLVGVALLLQYQLKLQAVGAAVSWAAIAVMGVAYWLDWKKIRPMREAAYKAATAKPEKPAKIEKADKSVDASDTAPDQTDTTADDSADQS